MKRLAIYAVIAFLGVCCRANAQSGTINTVAGGGSAAGDGGQATLAGLAGPTAVAVDGAGNIYFVDNYIVRVRKVSVNGVITTVAGTGTPGSSGDGGPAALATLGNPSGIAVDASGNLFIADAFYNRVRKVSTSGIITTVAGNGTQGYTGDGGHGDGGLATAAAVGAPIAVAVDAAGNLFILASTFSQVRKVSASGIITTVAGNGAQGYAGNFAGDGGPALSASMNPYGIAVDGSGNLFIADTGNNRIRKVSASGIITTVAGNGTGDFAGDGGPATAAMLDMPVAIAVDASGNIWISDRFNQRIREVAPGGLITTVAGNGFPGYGGDGGPATSASLHYPWGVAVDAPGNLFIADSANNRIRKVSPVAQIPAISLGASSLQFVAAAAAGGIPPSQTVAISNSGGGTLNWTATASTTSGGNWLSVSPGSGTNGGTLTVSAALTAQPIPLGTTATGTIQIAAAGASNSPQTIAVSLQNCAGVAITILPSIPTLAFTAQQGGANPANQTVNFGISGCQPFSWTATPSTTSGGNWLSVTPTSGTNSSSVTLTAAVNVASLAAGNFNGSVQIGVPGGLNSPVNVPVTLAVAATVSAPVVTLISPASATAGTAGFTLTVSGTGFRNAISTLQGPIPGSTVYWNTSALQTFIVSTTQLTAVVSASDIATAGSAQVTVQGGGVPISNELTFTIQPQVTQNGPAITSLSPPSVAPHGLGTGIAVAFLPLVVNGSGFVTASVVEWNGTTQQTTFVSSTQLKALIADDQIPGSASTAMVTVTNPAPGGGTSIAFPYPIDPAAAPVIIGLSPSFAPVGAGLQLTISGWNFNNGTVVRWNGSDRPTTPFFDPHGQCCVIYAAITASDMASVGTAQVTVFNAGAPVSNASTFTIQVANPSGAAITSVTTAYGPATIAQNTFIVIKGNNLVPASTPSSGAIWSTAPSFASGQMPTQLGGVSVTVNNKPAFVYFYCSAATDPACAQDQLNILTPLDNTVGTVPVVVTSGAVSSPPFSVNMQAVAPSFLLNTVAGDVVGTHANSSPVGPANLFPGVSTPAAAGEGVALYAVGFGLPSTPVANGSANQSGALPALPVCQIGGLAASVAYAGIISPGLDQINVTIPGAAANGENLISCTYNGATTPAGDLVAVQSSTPVPMLSVTTLGVGTVVTSPQGTSCGVLCYMFPAGTVVTVTGIGNSGWIFAGWSGACTGSGSCVITMSSSQSVTAMFNGPGSSTGTVYQTGFEAPAFGPGTINGQDSWAISGAAGSSLIESSVVRTGSQAVGISLAGATSGVVGAIRIASYAAANQVLTFSIDAQLTATGTPSFWTVLDTFFGGSGSNIDINVDQSGQIHVFFMGTDHPTGVTIIRGVWNTYRLEVSFVNNVVNVYYNNTQALQNTTFTPVGTTLGSYGFYAQGSSPLVGTDSGYFDNLSVAASTNNSVPTLVSVAITPSNSTVAVGATLQLTATGSYSDGSTQNLTNSASWSSSNTGIATVSASGLVSGVKAGSATISANSGTMTGTTGVTVGGAAQGPVITSLSTMKADPMAQLTINGLGFDPSLSTAVLFSGQNGYSVSEVAVIVAPTSITLAVPALFDLTTQYSIAGPASVSVVQGVGSPASSNSIGGFYINELPVVSLTPGAVTANYIEMTALELQNTEAVLLDVDNHSNGQISTASIRNGLASVASAFTSLAGAIRTEIGVTASNSVQADGVQPHTTLSGLEGPVFTTSDQYWVAVSNQAFLGAPPPALPTVGGLNCYDTLHQSILDPTSSAKSDALEMTHIATEIQLEQCASIQQQNAAMAFGGAGLAALAATAAEVTGVGMPIAVPAGALAFDLNTLGIGMMLYAEAFACQADALKHGTSNALCVKAQNAAIEKAIKLGLAPKPTDLSSKVSDAVDNANTAVEGFQAVQGALAPNINPNNSLVVPWGGSGTTPPPASDLTGTWSGPASQTGYGCNFPTGTILFTFTQKGSAIDGTLSLNLKLQSTDPQVIADCGSTLTYSDNVNGSNTGGGFSVTSTTGIIFSATLSGNTLIDGTADFGPANFWQLTFGPLTKCTGSCSLP